jgi:hypothetical protein
MDLKTLLLGAEYNVTFPTVSTIGTGLSLTIQGHGPDVTLTTRARNPSWAAAHAIINFNLPSRTSNLQIDPTRFITNTVVRKTS